MNVDLELLGSYAGHRHRKWIKIYQGGSGGGSGLPTRCGPGPSVEQLEAMIEELKMQLRGRADPVQFRSMNLRMAGPTLNSIPSTIRISSTRSPSR